MFSARALLGRLVARLGVVLGLVSPLGAQALASRTDTSRALSITFADGRIVSSPVRRTGGMWTPEFPRIAGAETSRNGLPLTTLDVKHETDGDDVVLTVSLSYGGPGRHPITVGTVRLSVATEQRRGDQRRAAQIVALLQILKAASSRPLASARQQIATGMDSDLEARRARDAVILQ